jgi:hypothetical protein
MVGGNFDVPFEPHRCRAVLIFTSCGFGHEHPGFSIGSGVNKRVLSAGLVKS